MPLGNYGGWTPTVLLGKGNPARNTGDTSICVSPPVDGLDQRGVSRFAGQNSRCDVGAVESDELIFADSFEPDDPIFADGFEQALP